MCERIFLVNLLAGISQRYYELTSSNYFSRDFIKWTPSNGYFSLLYKMLEKYLWNKQNYENLEYMW